MIHVLMAVALPFMARAEVSDAERANVDRVGVEIVNISVEGTDMVVGLSISAEGLQIPTLRKMMVEPVLRGQQGQELALPAIVYAGKQRFRFDRRAQLVHPAYDLVQPFRTFMGVREGRSYAVDYVVSVPYQVWMGSASLNLYYRLHDCCDELMVSHQLLIENLGMTHCDCPDTLPLPQSDIIFEPEVDPLYDADADAARHLYGGYDEDAQWGGAPIWQPDMELAAAMVLLIAPQVEPVKARRDTYTAYINFRQGRAAIEPQFGNNAAELQRIHELVGSIASDSHSTLQRIRIDGYASPEGAWGYNIDLSKRRAVALRDHIRTTWQLGDDRFIVEGHGEDWAGLEKLVEAAPVEQLPDRDRILDIIRGVDIFAGREAQLMDLNGGHSYDRMLADLFPQLRRMELSADYVVADIPEEQLEIVLAEHPERLSQQEMHRIAVRYPIGSRESMSIYEIAARHFPGDVVAANNAAAAAMLRGDVATARALLHKIKDDPRSFINQGVAAYIEEGPAAARAWFERAAAAGFEAGAYNNRMLETK